MGKPAARLTDMHTCPMVTPGTPPIPHVGGPISGPCVPTVMIGFMPAAVVGDMCVCVGPPDTIAMGSPTVLIGNKMAARIGDPTAHGGVIVVGCPTVLIGEMGSGGAGGGGGGMCSLSVLCPDIAALEELPLAKRLELEKTVADQVNDPNLAKLRHDRDMAVLSAATYQTKDGSPSVLPPGYSKAGPEDLKRLDITQSDLQPDMQLFKNSTGKPDYVMAYRGTETGAGAKTAANDIGVDAMQGAGYKTDAYTKGNATAKLVAMGAEENNLNVELTGHSKGGGQAAASSAATGLPATTFNGAGVHPNTLERAQVTPEQLEATKSNITAYNNERDPLNGAQDNRGKVLTGIGVFATFVAGVLGTAAVAALGVGGALPPVLGKRIVVPPARNQGTGMGEGHSIDTMVKALNEQITKKLKTACGC